MLRKIICMLTIMLTALSPIREVNAQSIETPQPPDDIIALADAHPELLADSAILIDAKTGKMLYGKNIDKKQYPASITKIMTLILAMEYNNFDETLKFSHEAIYGIEPGSSSIGMRVGEEISFLDGLYGIMLMSANEVSSGVAEHIDGTVEEFSLHMTQKAKELGCTNTNFLNPHGLPDENHYTSAHDMALIMKEALKYDMFRKIISTATYQIPETNITNEIRYLSNQHRMLRNDSSTYYNGCIGGKTGYTDDARHTLVTAVERNGMELIAVVLKDEKEERYTDTKALFDYGFSNFHTLTLFDKTNYSGTIKVVQDNDGDEMDLGEIGIIADEDLILTLQNEISLDDIIIDIDLPETVDAPIINNFVVGEITFSYKEEQLGSVKLRAAETVHSVEVKKETPLQETFSVIGEEPHENPNYLPIMFIVIILVLIVSFILYRGGTPKNDSYHSRDKKFR